MENDVEYFSNISKVYTDTIQESKKKSFGIGQVSSTLGGLSTQ
jgi:hypothetical protein